MLSKRKTYLLRLAAAVIALTLIILSCVLLMQGCVSSGGSYGQESGVAEPDTIIITTDGYIIKLQPDGMTAIKTDNGNMTIAKSKKAPFNQTPIDLIGYGNYIVSIVSYGQYHTLVSIYDAVDLNDGTDRLVPLRETVFYGDYYTCRISDETLYFVAKSSSNYVRYNPEKKEYEEAGAVDKITDTVEGEKEFNNINTESTDRVFGGYLLASLPLSSPATSKYTLSSYRAQDVSTLYFSQHGMYLVLSSYRSSGCGSVPQFRLCLVDINSLTVSAVSKERDGYIDSRYFLYDDGEYVFAAVSDSYASLCVYDRNMELVLAFENLANSSIASCRYADGFCYLELYSYVLKIDISNPLSPLIVETGTHVQASEHMYSFGSDNMIGAGRGNGIFINYYETTGDEFYLINTAAREYTGRTPEYREVTASADSSEVYICTDDGLMRFGLDLYGYMEYKDTQKVSDYITDVTLTESQSRIYRAVIINNYLYAVADGAVLSFACDDFSFVSSITTIL